MLCHRYDVFCRLPLLPLSGSLGCCHCGLGGSGGGGRALHLALQLLRARVNAEAVAKLTLGSNVCGGGRGVQLVGSCGHMCMRSF